MPTTTDPPIPPLTFLSSLTPPSQTRAWQSAPHPTHPILATASSDKTVRIYSLTNFSLLSTISGGHKRSIRTVAWKPGVKGESVLATGSFDASAGIWRRWDDAEVRGGRNFTSAGVGDGERGEGGEEEEEDGLGGGLEREREENDEEDEDEEWRFSCILDGPDSEIKRVAWSCSGQFLATCSRDKSVWVWEELDDDNFETVAVLQEHEGDVKAVAWHPEEDLLASASYDESVRLWREDVDDWACCAVLSGHGETVWGVAFEGPAGGAGAVGLRVRSGERGADEGSMSEEQKAYVQELARAGPRLVSCSADLTTRVWRRRPKVRPDTPPPTGQGRIPSILKTNSIEEEWFEEAQLPRRHERAVYAVEWSRKSGRVVTCGGDGKIVVYQERWREAGDTVMRNGVDREVDGKDEKDVRDGIDDKVRLTEWVVVAEMDGAHDVFEVNHVCWALRRDKGRRSDEEEVIVSTGDDGEVKVWCLNPED